ncbi:MAG: hypothetical protein H3C38_03270 [Rhodospirillales bacterium]|nr:hypothetical protein [Rhodospirillales bacterium]
MRYPPLRLIVAALFVSVLAACEMPAPQQQVPQLTYSHLKPYQLDVGRLEVVTEYRAPLREPNIEHIMPVSPEAAAKRWAQDRLQPMGRSGAARFIIRSAPVVEVPLKVDTGVAGLFKKQQEARYDAALEVVFQILDERQFPQAEIVARGARSRTVPEGTTLNQRDRIWYEMTESLMHDLNGQMEGLIGQYMARWLL